MKSLLFVALGFFAFAVSAQASGYRQPSNPYSNPWYVPAPYYGSYPPGYGSNWGHDGYSYPKPGGSFWGPSPRPSR